MRSTMSLKSYNVSMKYTINSQKISTQHLTVLTTCVILHAEQRGAAKKREFPTPDRFPAGQNKTGQQDGGRALPKFFHIDNNELHQ